MVVGEQNRGRVQAAFCKRLSNWGTIARIHHHDLVGAIGLEHPNVVVTKDWDRPNIDHHPMVPVSARWVNGTVW